MEPHISDAPPTSRAFLEAVALDIGAVLKSYVEIDKDFFRLSTLFQSIDYDGYCRQLSCLCEKLVETVGQLPTHSDEAPELLGAIKGYSDALFAAMSSLRKICGSLGEKVAHGADYGWFAYRCDLKCYKADVGRYSQIGSRLNVLLNNRFAGGMVTTDWDFAVAFHIQFPHTFKALQKLVVAMAAYQKNRRKKTLFGKDKGMKSYIKFESVLRDVLIAMSVDGVVARNRTAKVYLTMFLYMLAEFAKIFPNWQDAYAFADEYFVKNAITAEDRIRDMLRQ